MTDQEDLKERIKELYWDCCYREEKIAKELGLSVDHVTEYIKKFKLEIWRMIPWKSEKLKKLSYAAQRLLVSMIYQMKSGNPSPRPVSRRDEANVMTYTSFRNGYIEEIHSRPASRISDEEMKKIMIESSARLEDWLEIRDAFLPERPDLYFPLVHACRDAWTRDWEQEKRNYDIKD